MWRAGLGLLAILVPSTAAAQTETGTVELHLGLPLGTVLLQTTAQITNGFIGFSQTVQEPHGPGPFLDTLPVANGYAVSVASTTVSGLVCSGLDAGFPIVANGTTIVFVNMTCVSRTPLPAPALGRFAPLLGLLLAALGALALRARRRDRFRSPPGV